MELIKVFIADGNPENNTELRSFFSKTDRISIVGECKDGELVVKMCLDFKPDVVLIDMDLPGVDGITVSKMLTSIVPSVLVIITGKKAGKETIKRAMAAGARDFVEKPFTAHKIVHCVIDHYDNYKRSLSIVENSNYKELKIKNEIITVFSTKGGVGKTTLSSNIAVALARKTQEKVVVLDFDFQFGDIPIMFNVYPKRTILDLNNEIQNLDSDLLEEYLIDHPSGIKILPAPLSPEYAEYITTKSIQKILNLLLEKYRYIVIDTAPAFHDINLAAMDVSDKILFITTTDLSTIKNVKLGLNVMKTLNYGDSKVNLLLNRYSRKFGVSKNDLQRSIGKKVLFTIPEEPITAIQAMNKGVPLVLSDQKSKMAKRLMEIADSIIADKKAVKKGILQQGIR